MKNNKEQLNNIDQLGYLDIHSRDDMSAEQEKALRPTSNDSEEGAHWNRDRSDSVLIGMAVNRRWPIDTSYWSEELHEAYKVAKDKRSENAMARCIQIAAQMEKQNQEDEQYNDKNQRLDEGLPTDNVTLNLEFDK